MALIFNIIHYGCIWIFIATAIILSIIAIVKTEDSNGDPITLDKIHLGPSHIMIPPKDTMVAPYIYNLGFRSFRGKDNVQTIVIMHPIKYEGNALDQGSCCKVIFPCVRWQTTENYVVDPSNNDGLSSGFVTQAISNGMAQYNNVLPFNIFGNLTTDTFGNIDISNPDGKNEILFAIINSQSIIAATFVHIQNNFIIESDIVLNDFFPWGDASIDSSKMDLGNIITHEEGHSAGLDHPSSVPTCSDTTMYPTAGFGETKKRTLSPDDIQCVQDLYNANCTSSSSSSSSIIISNLGYIIITYLLFLI